MTPSGFMVRNRVMLGAGPGEFTTSREGQGSEVRGHTSMEPWKLYDAIAVKFWI